MAMCRQAAVLGAQGKAIDSACRTQTRTVRLETDGVAVYALDVATVAVKGLASALPPWQHPSRTLQSHLFLEDSHGLRLVEHRQ
jgi:hypothetical protein